MFQKVNGLWSFLGVSLALVALYLVLVNATGAAKVTSSLTGGAAGFFRTLQGR